MIKMILGAALMSGTLVMAATSASASGSGGGGGYGSGGGGYSGPSTPHDPLADAYARGKSHFKKHVTCKKCEFPQGVNDSITAGKLAKRISAGEFSFTPRQRQDVMLFLQKRYGVTG